jgi:hypothetical protein
MKNISKELRQERRGPISVPVYFSKTADATSEKNTIRQGTTADLSNSGLGIFSDVELKPDTMIEIECRDIWDAPNNFVVQWCNRVKYDFYRIGLEKLAS